MSYQKQLIQQALQGVRQTNDGIKISNAKLSAGKSDLNEIRGIGDATMSKLHESGIKSREQLKTLGEEGIKDIKLNPLSLKRVLSFIRGE